MDSSIEPKEYELAVLSADEAYEVSFASGIEVLQKEGPKSVPLGYAIKKHISAFLRAYVLRMLPQTAAGLNRVVEADQAVLRHLLVTPPIVVRRRERETEVREKGEPVRPTSPESVSNAALEAVLENIQGNAKSDAGDEPRLNESQ